VDKGLEIGLGLRRSCEDGALQIAEPVNEAGMTLSNSQLVEPLGTIAPLLIRRRQPRWNGRFSTTGRARVSVSGGPDALSPHAAPLCPRPQWTATRCAREKRSNQTPGCSRVQPAKVISAGPPGLDAADRLFFGRTKGSYEDREDPVRQGRTSLCVIFTGAPVPEGA